MKASGHISLSGLQQLIARRLDESFDAPLWVSAEIAELRLNRSGHCYMELVEKGAGEALPSARCSAAIWRSRYESLAAYFRAETGKPLEAGMKVLLRVTVNYHPLYGLSLSVLDVDPAYTLGDWQQQKLQTIARLKSDGVMDMNRQCEPVPDMLRIAVVSSATAAGYGDFRNQTEASPWNFRTELFEAFMQGEGAEDSVTAALDAILERTEEFDAVVIIRGGGSQSDLSCFNSYRLCSHIAQFPLPVITGIGHDRDVSVADMVAFTALKTPTAVAAFLIDNAERQFRQTEQASAALERYARSILERETLRTTSAARGISLRTAEVARQTLVRLERLSTLLHSRSQGLLERQHIRTADCLRRTVSASRLAIGTQRTRLEALSRQTEQQRPQRILSLGFAIVRSGGTALHDAAQTRIGQQIDITLDRGEVRAKITDNGKK